LVLLGFGLLGGGLVALGFGVGFDDRFDDGHDLVATHEIARTNEPTLTTWNRQAAPVGRDAWRTARSTDARWCWLIALALLGLEQWLRTKGIVRRSQEVTRAAA